MRSEGFLHWGVPTCHRGAPSWGCVGLEPGSGSSQTGCVCPQEIGDAGGFPGPGGGPRGAAGREDPGATQQRPARSEAVQPQPAQGGESWLLAPATFPPIPRLGSRGFSLLQAASVHRGAIMAVLSIWGITRPSRLPALIPPYLPPRCPSQVRFRSQEDFLLSVPCVPRASGSPGTLTSAAETPRSPGAPPAQLGIRRGPGPPCALCAHLHGRRGTGGNQGSLRAPLGSWRGAAAARAPPAPLSGRSGGQGGPQALPSARRKTGGAKRRGAELPGRLGAWGKCRRGRAGGIPCTPRVLGRARIASGWAGQGPHVPRVPWDGQRARGKAKRRSPQLAQHGGQRGDGGTRGSRCTPGAPGNSPNVAGRASGKNCSLSSPGRARTVTGEAEGSPCVL